MQTYLTVKVLGVVGAIVGPWPDWNSCTQYLPDFEKRADAAFQKPELVKDMEKDFPGIKRKDIVHECVESATKPELGDPKK